MAFHLQTKGFKNSNDICFFFYFKNNISLSLTISNIVLTNGHFVSADLLFYGGYSNDPVTGVPLFSNQTLPISDRPVIYQDLVFFKKVIVDGVTSFYIDCFDPEFFCGYVENALLSEMISFSVADVAADFPSAFLVAPPVDLNSIHLSLETLTASISEVRSQSDVLATTVSTLSGQTPSGSTVSLSDILSKIDALDLQIPDNLNTQLSELSDDIANIDLAPLSNISLPASLTGLTPIDITNLDGNFCKFVAGDLVFFGLYGIWEVVKASFILVDENHFTPSYQIRQVVSEESVTPVVFRYIDVPQSVLQLFIPPKPAPATPETVA